MPVEEGEDHDESTCSLLLVPKARGKDCCALTPNVGDEPEEDVRVYTVSRIPLGR